MELYGARLHLLCSITGGFLLHSHDTIPNIIKISSLIIFSVLFFILFTFDLNFFAGFMLSALIAILVLIIELIVIWFHTLLDDSVDNSDSSYDANQDTGIPSGISGPLWESRHVLFNNRLPMDERAYQLVRRGFDVEEVFRLVELVDDGTITPQTRARSPVRKIHSTTIIICGQVINLHFDRETLSRTFARPANNWHLLSSIILTFLLGISSYISSYLFQPYLQFYVALICSIALNSLLNPPPCDPYSTSFYDPYISYTRASAAVGLFGTAAVLSILEEYVPTSISISGTGITIELVLIMDTLKRAAYYGALAYPFLILLGFIGHPITTIHYLLESLNKYLYGVSGSVSLYKAFFIFITSSILLTFVSIFLLIGNQPIVIAICIFIVTFFIQFSVSSSCTEFLRKHLLPASISAAASGVTVLLNYIIPESWDIPLLYLITSIHFLIDVAFPYVTTHQFYFSLFHGRLLNINYLTKYAHHITNFITAPLFLSITLSRTDTFAVVSAAMLIHGLRLAQTVPHLFCYSLFLTMFFFKFDLGIDNLPSSLMLSMLVARKFVKVERAVRVWFKFRRIPKSIYNDPLVNKCQYADSILATKLICYAPPLTCAISFPSFFWTIVTGAPMSVWRGYHQIFMPSPPRPNSFYDQVPTDSSHHDEYRQAMFDHPLEGPIYMSLANALQTNLGKMVKNGNLGLVCDDDFFLTINGDLMAIVHIIQVDANKVCFQLRGLEYVHQTLCHGGELSALQQIEMEHKQFGNMAHAVIFNHSTFELRAKNIELPMLMMSQLSLQESVIDILQRPGFLQWEFRSLVYFALKKFGEEENPPHKEYPPAMNPSYNMIHGQYILDIASFLGIEFSELMAKRLFVITHCINSLIMQKNGLPKVDAMCDIFDGKITPDPMLQGDEELMFECLRFSVAVLLMASIQDASFESNREIFEFLQEIDQSHMELPIKSDEMENTVKNLADGMTIISLFKLSEGVTILRFEKGVTKWSVFQMESEMIRGLWANEAKSILFNAMPSRERNSIQFDIQSLRNITNQSCNQPIGYPVYVTEIMSSTYDPYEK